MKIRIKKIVCTKCTHIWTPRKSDVRRCPKCQSVYFDIPKLGDGENEKERL